MMHFLKKYKLIALPMAMVLIFDISLLATNYLLSAQLEETSININIAGRQRMLSQKMTKALLLTHYLHEASRPSHEPRKELEEAITLFNQTLVSFLKGGHVIGASGQQTQIKKLTDGQARSTLNQALTIWQPFHLQLTELVNTEHLNTQASARLIEALAAENIELLKLMNDLTNQLEHSAREKTYFLRGIQTLVVIMILISFAIATSRVMRRDKYYKRLMESSTDIIISIDTRTGTTTFVSSSAEQILGHKEAYYLGHPADLFFTDESKLTVDKILREAYKKRQLDSDRCEISLQKEDGSTIVADMVMQLSVSENGRSLELNADIRDISDRKRVEVALSKLVHKDPLTDLPNRTLFYQLAEHAILTAKRQGNNIAVLFLDLDGFKMVNDNYGHDIGDLLLRAIAKRIEDCLRESDSVSRLGGDEFIILLQNINSRDDITALGLKLIQAISKPVEIEQHLCQVGASIGVAIYPEHGQDIETLLREADKAMYTVKKAGKNAITFAS